MTELHGIKLPAALHAALPTLLANTGLAKAFAVRRELINFKKLCNHQHAELVVVNTKLRQLSAFFWQLPDKREATREVRHCLCP